MNHTTAFSSTIHKLSRVLILIVSIMLIGFLNNDTALASGVLDPAFGTGGQVTVSFGSIVHASTVLIQPDGRIVLVGSAGASCALVRLRTDGTLDDTFGTGGKTVTSMSMYAFEARGAALQPDGKIVVVVSVTHPNLFPPQEIMLIRYTADGNLDTSFDGDGKLWITSTHICDGLSVAVQPDGKILAGGGNPYFSGGPFGWLVRLNDNGTMDTSFDGDGQIFNSGPPIVQLALQSDGRILAGSTILDLPSAVSRYNSNGSLDPTFATGVLGRFDVRSDDKIVGRAQVGTSGSDTRVQRFNSNGSVDTSFVNNLVESYEVRDISAAPNGDVVEVGSSFGISLFKSNGIFNGFLRAFPGDSPSSGWKDSAVQPDGKVLVLGTAYFNATGFPDFVVLRYLDVKSSTRRPSDFDGDFQTDFAVYRAGGTPSAASYWHVFRSDTNTYQGVQFGAGQDRIVPADYDGDGKTDFAVWRPSTGYWYTSLSPTINYGAFQWGTNGDIPIPGDFDGDGKADHAVFRPSNGYWYISRSSDGAFSFQQFGSSTDKPLLGDFDGDGKSDLAYLRTVGSDFIWHIFQSSNSTEVIQKFGIVGDKAVAADFDGDGKTNIAVFRPSTSKWYTSTDPGINYGEMQWGISGDVPAPGDFDGDGNSDLTVFRPGSSVWYVLNSGTGTIMGRQWGISTDLPVTAAFIPQ